MIENEKVARIVEYYRQFYGRKKKREVLVKPIWCVVVSQDISEEIISIVYLDSIQ